MNWGTGGFFGGGGGCLDISVEVWKGGSLGPEVMGRCVLVWMSAPRGFEFLVGLGFQWACVLLCGNVAPDKSFAFLQCKRLSNHRIAEKLLESYSSHTNIVSMPYNPRPKTFPTESATLRSSIQKPDSSVEQFCRKILRYGTWASFVNSATTSWRFIFGPLPGSIKVLILLLSDEPTCLKKEGKNVEFFP